VTFEQKKGGTVSAQFDWTILPRPARAKGGKD
jgi:hypothetical protein